MNPSDPKPEKTSPAAEYIPLNFAPDAFSGTADYYVRFRVPYPDILVRDLIRRLNCTGQGHLLDLACGPGRVALTVASSFREISAVDLEPEMLEAGRAEAARRGVSHIRWIQGRAEEIDFADDSFEAVVIGEAFHRLDQERVAAQTLRWLKPGGALVTLGSFSMLSEREAWQKIVVDAIRRWTSWRPRAPLTPAARKALGGPDEYERAMRAAGYRDVSTHPFTIPHTWTLDAILGYLYSTSVASKRALGTKAAAFESELRALLLAHESSGKYVENTDWGYTLGRKPG